MVLIFVWESKSSNQPWYNRYMQLSIVSYLDENAAKEVRKLQEIMSEVTGSKASLYSWAPHITLGDGIDVTDLELTNLIDGIKHTGQSTPIFTITASGFNFLDSRPVGVGEVSTPYTIFIGVAISQELLNLVSRIREITDTRSKWYQMPRPYRPHVTIAFRDLSEVGYQNGLNYLIDRKVRLTSTIDHIALVQKLPEIDTELMRIPLSQF